MRTGKNHMTTTEVTQENPQTWSVVGVDVGSLFGSDRHLKYGFSVPSTTRIIRYKRDSLSDEGLYTHYTFKSTPLVVYFEIVFSLSQVHWCLSFLHFSKSQWEDFSSTSGTKAVAGR